MGMTSKYLTVSAAEPDEILAGGSKMVFSALRKATLGKKRLLLGLRKD